MREIIYEQRHYVTKSFMIVLSSHIARMVERNYEVCSMYDLGNS
jgi:hypothetical protein